MDSTAAAAGGNVVITQFFSSFVPEYTGGFLIMWVILLFFICMIAIVVERYIFIYRRANIKADLFMAEIRRTVTAGDFKKAIALCKSGEEKALPQVILAALEVAEKQDFVDARAIQNAVEEKTLEIIPGMTGRIGWLMVLGNVATLTGLFGTIYGLMFAFEAAGKAGAGGDLAKGISTAMLTTIWGLAVAIPGTVAFNFLNNKAMSILEDMDQYSLKLNNLLTGGK